MGTPRSERTVCAALNSIPHNSSFFTLLLASVCEACLQNKFKKNNVGICRSAEGINAMFQAVVITFPLKSLQFVLLFRVPSYTLIGLLFLEPREKAKGLTST